MDVNLFEEFHKLYSKFIGTQNENPNDTTSLLLQLIECSRDVSNTYREYYLDQEFDTSSYVVNKLFNYNFQDTIPYLYQIKLAIRLYSSIDSFESFNLEIPKYSTLKSSKSNYILLSPIVAGNYVNKFNLEIVQGTLASQAINQRVLASDRQCEIEISSGITIYPNIGYLEIDGIKYENYSIPDAKYSDSELAYAIERDAEGKYNLIISQRLADKILNYSSIALTYLVIDSNNFGATIDSLKITSGLPNSVSAEISELLVVDQSKYALRSTSFVDFATNIVREDYEQNIKELENIATAKVYDLSSYLTPGEIIELDETDPSKYSVKLGYYQDADPSKGLINVDTGVPYYAYVVIAPTIAYTLQLKREIMKSISRGLISKELLLDYGDQFRDNFKVSENGYSVSPTFIPQQLPYIVNSENSIMGDVDAFQQDYQIRQEMPDIVLQIERAQFIPIDIEIDVKLNYSDASELANFQLSLIAALKEYFAVSKSNSKLQFNSLLRKSDIRDVVYAFDVVEAVAVSNFTYWRNNIPTRDQEIIQFGPFELPVLGSLKIVTNYEELKMSDSFKTFDQIVRLNKEFLMSDRFKMLDQSATIQLKLKDSLSINDNIEHLPVTVQVPKIEMTYWVILADSNLVSAPIVGEARTAIMPIRNSNITKIDSKEFTDDNSEIGTETPGLFTDSGKSYRNY